MPKALAFSQPAARRFQAGVDIANDWSTSYQFGGEGDDISSVQLGDAVFVFRNDETSIAPSIVIKLEEDKLFSCFSDEAARLEPLKRAIDAGMIALEGGGALPSYWRPFTGEKFMTFQALPVSNGDARRLVLWRRLSPAPNPCAFIFDVTEKQSDYTALAPDLKLLNTVLSDRSKALATLPRRENLAQVGPAALTLNELRPSEQVDTVIHGWKLGYLYMKVD